MILKIHSRCNINCSYCYMYNLGGDASASMPKVMDMAHVERATMSAVRDCEENYTDRIDFSLHGGEPLLVGKAYMQTLLKRIAALSEGIPLSLTVQTNGLLLDDEWCDLFEQFGVNVGISIDLPDVRGETQRRDFRGRDTFERVVDKIRQFRTRRCFVGIIMVASEHGDGRQAIDLLCGDLQAPWFDILIPDLTHDHVADAADWVGTQRRLLQFYTSAFDRWAERYADVAKCRLFDNLVTLQLGGASSVDAVGKAGVSALVMETDGSIELHDTLRICQGFDRRLYETAPDHLYEALRTNERYRQVSLGDFPIAPKCRACDVRPICKGGELAHRYSTAGAFTNASVHCDLLYNLIKHVGVWTWNQLSLGRGSEAERPVPTVERPSTALPDDAEKPSYSKTYSRNVEPFDQSCEFPRPVRRRRAHFAEGDAGSA